MEGPRAFAEKVVVDMCGGMPLLYRERHRAAMERLLRDGTVDRVIYATPDAVRPVCERWFGTKPLRGGLAGGRPYSVMFGLDSCMGDYMLCLDGDTTISRKDHTRDYLAETVGALRRNTGAVLVPIWGILHGGGCMYDMRRLQSMLPVSGYGGPAPAWSRILGGLVPGDSSGDTIRFVSDNQKAAEWPYAGVCGNDPDWAGPRRSEPFVFVVCGGSVDPGLLKRCCQSMIR